MPGDALKEGNNLNLFLSGEFVQIRHTSSGKKYFRASRFEPLDDSPYVIARNGLWDSLRNVVAAELNDDDIRLLGKSTSESAQRLCACAGRYALIDDAVRISALLQFDFQERGIGRVPGDTVSRRHAVANGDNDMFARNRQQRCCQQKGQNS